MPGLVRGSGAEFRRWKIRSPWKGVRSSRRRSVRAFLPRAVPRELVERLLTLAARAPSNSNTQPWHVHVLTGEAKRVLGEAIVQELEANGRVAETEYAYQPKEWSEPFQTRRRQ